MRKLVFLAVVFLGGIAAQANQVTNLDHNTTTGIRYNKPQSITFIQRGVQYFVYPNGEFDYRVIRSQYRGRRGNYNNNAPGTTYGVTYATTNRARVSYDFYGNIIKIGRVNIFYNRRGKVNQIGNVSLRYRHGRLVRVGNLHITYDGWGRIAGVNGYVYNDIHNCGICGIEGCTINHFDYEHDQDEHWNDWDVNWNNNRPFRRNRVKNGRR